jgi:hypothetical protein
MAFVPRLRHNNKPCVLVVETSPRFAKVTRRHLVSTPIKSLSHRNVINRNALLFKPHIPNHRPLNTFVVNVCLLALKSSSLADKNAGFLASPRARRREKPTKEFHA